MANKINKQQVLDIIDFFFTEKQIEMNAHVAGFGQGDNRDIDPREKAMLLTLPIGYKKKLKERFALVSNSVGGKDGKN